MSAAYDYNRVPTQGFPVPDPKISRAQARNLTDDLVVSFGRRLKLWREHRDLSRRDLGFFAECSEDSIRNYELAAEGKTKVPAPLLSTANRIALALDLDLPQLLFMDPPPKEGAAEAPPPSDEASAAAGAPSSPPPGEPGGKKKPRRRPTH